MINHQHLTEVILGSILKPTTETAANEMATQLGLPAGSVKFGAKAIEITQEHQTIYVQIKPEGNDILVLDVPPA